MRKIYTLILGLVLSQGVAQDPSFSQFYANRIYLNPAFTGLENGVSIAGVSRMQWTNIDDGFRTYGFTAEIQEPFINSGIGLSFFQDRQGLAQLNSTSIGMSYSYLIPLDGNNIHIGIETLWNEKKVDWEKLVFSDQLDAVNGAVNSTTFIPLLEKTTYTDFNLGVLWRFNTDLKLKKRTIRDLHHSVGISMHHLPALFGGSTGGESLQNLETQLTPRLTVHAGSIIPLTYFNGTKNKVMISPNIKVDVQGEGLFQFKENLQVFTYGTYFLYEGYYIGALYQNKNIFSHHKNTNAWILAMGAYINSENGNKLFVGFSYDANTTGVGTRAGGVYEIAFRWTGNAGLSFFGGSSGGVNGSRINSRKGGKKRKLDCYHFF